MLHGVADTPCSAADTGCGAADMAHGVAAMLHSVADTQDTLLKDRQRQLVSIQPMRVQIAGLPCTVIISLSE